MLGEQIEFTDESLHDLIHHYTREAGVAESRTRDRYSRAEAGASNRARARRRSSSSRPT